MLGIAVNLYVVVVVCRLPCTAVTLSRPATASLQTLPDRHAVAVGDAGRWLRSVPRHSRAEWPRKASRMCCEGSQDRGIHTRPMSCRPASGPRLTDSRPIDVALQHHNQSIDMAARVEATRTGGERCTSRISPALVPTAPNSAKTVAILK